MSLIIDVDSHAEPAPGWLDEFPALKQRLPAMLPTGDPQFVTGEASPEMFAWFIAVDLLRGRPVGSRMAAKEMVTPVLRLMYDPDRPDGVGYPGADQHSSLDADARVAWMDDNGIAVQNLISGMAYTLARAIDDPVLSMDALEAANTWLSDRIGDHNDRLKLVTTLRFEDLDRAIAEMRRMRDRGSRTFLVSGEPVGDIPPFHPSFDRLWSAATDLGMMPMLHVGLGPAAIHPGWANTDDPGLVTRMATSQSSQAAQVMLNAMVFGGVFERHPALTLLISEFGVDWLPGTVANMDGRAAPAAPLLGDYTLALTPSEYVRRNVRISPLPVPHQVPLDVIDALPGVAVFSSDYPHYEGNHAPVDHYRHELAAVDDEVRARFMGETINDSYRLLGDPLVA
jgi:predicted TIM-barrel fold metal-dependent hydrolase